MSMAKGLNQNLKKGCVNIKNFHIGDILSITTGKLVSPQGMEGVYEILNYMTGQEIFTHQIERAMQECKLYLLKQYPKLETVECQSIDIDNWQDWIAAQIDKFGECLAVDLIPVRNFKDPITDIKEALSEGRTE